MRILTCILAILLTGCSGLLIRSDDPTPLVVTKTIWRGVLGVSTLGLSEIRMSELRDELNAEASTEQRLQDYEAHLTYLVNNGALSQGEAEELYQKYANLVFQEALEVAAGGGASDYWVSSGMAGYPIYHAGSLSMNVAGFPNTFFHLRSGTGYQRTFGLAKSRSQSARWSRPGMGSRSYFRGASSGKGSGRRGGRR